MCHGGSGDGLLPAPSVAGFRRLSKGWLLLSGKDWLLGHEVKTQGLVQAGRESRSIREKTVSGRGGFGGYLVPNSTQV